MFRSRQATNYLLANRQYFLFINSQLKKEKFSNVHQLHPKCFGSSTILLESLSLEKQRQCQQYAQQIGGGTSNKMLVLGLGQQKRFFASAEISSSAELSSEQQEEQQQKIEKGSTTKEQKIAAGLINLDKKMLRLSPAVVLYLKLEQGKQMKFFKLDRVYAENGRGVPTPFPKLTLEVAYPMISAMDELLNTLTLVNKHREMSISSEQPGPVVVVESKCVNGPFYDFQLKLVQHSNTTYVFKMKTIKTVKDDHKEKELSFPIRALPWLRQTMAQMLVEHDADGSQQLGPAPPELPESILKARSVAQNRPQRRNQRQQQQFNPPASNKQQNQQIKLMQQQLQLVQQQLQQMQQIQLIQQQQSLPLPNFGMAQPQQLSTTAASPNPALQQLAQLRAQMAQLEAAVAATAMSPQTTPQQPPQQQFHPSFPFGKFSANE